MKRVSRACSLVGAVAFLACSSNDPVAPPNGAPDAAAGSGDARDASALPDLPEPPWSGVTVEPGCTANGCIRDFTLGSTVDRGLLETAAASGNSVDNGLIVYTIRYMSDGDEITGSVYVPDSAPPAEGYSVVVMNQFTSGVGDACAPSKGNLGIGVASATALRGILTIVPDEASYGPPPVGVYLAASQAGRAALDAARAAFHLAPALGKPIARKAVIAGHSQGGHSTMAAAAELRGYAPKLEIRGFAANAPPANFRAGGNAVLRGTTGFGTFIAMRLWTWQRYYALGGEPIFREPYASQAEGWFSSECLFVGSNGKVDTALDAHWPSDASTVISDPYLGYAKTDQWPEAWARVLDASTPIPKDIPQPIVVFQGTKDAIVPKVDTDAYVAQLRAAGIAIDYRVVEGGEHPNTSLSSFTVPQLANEAAVTWIREHLAN